MWCSVFTGEKKEEGLQTFRKLKKEKNQLPPEAGGQ